MKNRDIYWRRYKIQETLHIRQWCLSPIQSRHLGTSQVSQSPSSALSYFPESHWWSEISFLSKVISFGEARSLRVPNLGHTGAESRGWFDVSQKTSAWDVMHEQMCCHDKGAIHQLRITETFWIIKTMSAEECSSLTQILIQILCSTCSVILNVTATQYTCSLKGVYCPHWLVQWSHHYLLMLTPLHSSHCWVT